MNNTKSKSCADLIAGKLNDRQEQLKELYTLADNDDDNAREEIYSMAYGIDRREIVRVIWSGGGPADYLEITHTGGEILRVEYLYQDWYDGASIDVDEGTPAYRYAEEILEMISL